MTDQSLIQLDQITKALSHVKTIQDVKVVRDQAQALCDYAKQAGYCFEIQNHCAEIKVRAERKAGEILKGMPKQQGARGFGKKVEFHDGTPLSESGVTKKESHRWQRMAAVPPETFEQYVAKTKEAKKEITSAAVLKMANAHKPKNGAEVVVNNNTGFITALETLVGQKFQCIYADPPWKYDNQGTRGSTDNHYKTMSVDDICLMPIKDLAAENCHLHLWTTNAFLFECPKILDAWGFTFKSSYVWVKDKIGMGNYWRNSHEILLLAVRGRLTAQNRSLRSWGQFERRKHSEKPEEIRATIEKLSPGPYLELFGRKTINNWTVYGNQHIPA